MEPLVGPMVIQLLDLCIVLRAQEIKCEANRYRTHFACTPETLKTLQSFPQSPRSFTDTFLGRKLSEQQAWLKRRSHETGKVEWILRFVPGENKEGMIHKDITDEEEICEHLAMLLKTEKLASIDAYQLEVFQILHITRIFEKQGDINIHIDVVEFDKQDFYMVGTISTELEARGSVPNNLVSLKALWPVRSKITEIMMSPSPGETAPNIYLSELNVNRFRTRPTISTPIESPKRPLKTFTANLGALGILRVSDLKPSSGEIEDMLKEADIKYEQEHLTFLEKYYNDKYRLPTPDGNLNIKFGLALQYCNLQGFKSIIDYYAKDFGLKKRPVVPVGEVKNHDAVIFLRGDGQFFLFIEKDRGYFSPITPPLGGETDFLRKLGNTKVEDLVEVQ